MFGLINRHYLRKGWINSNGTINEDIKTRYNEISGLSESISECFSKSKYKNYVKKMSKHKEEIQSKKKRMMKKGFYKGLFIFSIRLMKSLIND